MLILDGEVARDGIIAEISGNDLKKPDRRPVVNLIRDVVGLGSPESESDVEFNLAHRRFEARSVTPNLEAMRWIEKNIDSGSPLMMAEMRLGPNPSVSRLPMTT